MQRIIILTPYGLEKEVYNVLSPIAKEHNFDITSSEMLGRLLQQIPQYKNSNNIFRTLVSGIESKELFIEDNMIWIGACNKEVNYTHSYAYFPDVLEAEEELIKICGFDSESKLLLSNQYEEKSNNIVNLVKIVSKWIDEGKNVKSSTKASN